MIATWEIVHGDCAEILSTMAPTSVDHVITDPPYGENVHGQQRRMLRGAGAGHTARTHRGADGRGRGLVGPADLGFEALTLELRRSCGAAFARLTRRWVLVFADMEGQGGWQADLQRAGARHVRFGVWWKIAAQPQLSGDRPASACEAVEISHARGERMRWNGGGLPGRWGPTPYPIETDRNATGARVHTTQKPLALMLELVGLFTDPGDLVLDPFCGSGTTGVACIRLGRRFLGIEKDAKYAAIARERLEAESKGLTLTAARAGQRSLFG